MNAVIKKIVCFAFLASCLLAGRANAQVLPATEAETQIRTILSDIHAVQITPEQPAPPSKEEEVMKVAKQSNLTAPQIQTLLSKLVDESIAASRGADERQARTSVVVGRAALGVIGHLGGKSQLDRLTDIAVNDSGGLGSAATRATLKLAIRVAPDDLAVIARKVAAGNARMNAYDTLGDYVKYSAPELATERARVIAAIVGIWREGFVDPSFDDKIMLDQMLEEYDPAFRTSEIRRQGLMKLKSSESVFTRDYAQKKLAEFPPGGNEASSASETAVTGRGETVLAAPAQEKRAAESVATSVPGGGRWLAAGGAIALLLLLIGFRRRRHLS